VSRDEQDAANRVRLIENKKRTLLRTANRGGAGAAFALDMLKSLESGEVDPSRLVGLKRSNFDKDLNAAENKADQKRQQGFGATAAPATNPGNAGGMSATNQGTQKDRDDLAREASAAGGATTSPATQGSAGNGQPASRMSFEEQDQAARERSTASGAFGKVDEKGELVKTDYRKMAQEAFYADLDKSSLIGAGRARSQGYEWDNAPADYGEAVSKAQQKALERGLSLGGNREELQARIGMETDTQTKERMAGEKTSSESDAKEKRLEAINQRISKVGQKASDDYLLENKDAFDRIEESTRKAAEARDAQGDTITTTEERIARAEAPGEAQMAELKKRQATENETLRRTGIAEDTIREERSKLVKEGLDLLTLASSAFVPGELFEGNWMEDPSLLPSSDKIGEMSDDQIKDYSKLSIDRKINTAKSFNEELGGESKTSIQREKRKAIDYSSGIPSSSQGKVVSKADYQTDSFSGLKKNALGLEPNWEYDPRGETEGPERAARNPIEGLIQTGRIIREMGTTAESRAQPYRRANPIKVASAQYKILNAAAKTGYPIWKDKELMADPDFRKRIEGDPRFHKQIQRIEEERKREEDKKNLSKATVNPFAPK